MIAEKSKTPSRMDPDGVSVWVHTLHGRSGFCRWDPKMNPRDTSGCSQSPSRITKSLRPESILSRGGHFSAASNGHSTTFQ